MAAVVALGNKLGEDAVSLIFDFLEDSSVAATGGMDTANIADLGDFSNGTSLRANHYPEPPGTLYVLYWGSLDPTLILHPQ